MRFLLVHSSGIVRLGSGNPDDEQLLENVRQGPKQAKEDLQHSIRFPMGAHHVATLKFREVKLRRPLGSWMLSMLWLLKKL